MQDKTRTDNYCGVQGRSGSAEYRAARLAGLAGTELYPASFPLTTSLQQFRTKWQHLAPAEVCACCTTLLLYCHVQTGSQVEVVAGRVGRVRQLSSKLKFIDLEGGETGTDEVPR